VVEEGDAAAGEASSRLQEQQESEWCKALQALLAAGGSCVPGRDAGKAAAGGGAVIARCAAQAAQLQRLTRSFSIACVSAGLSETELQRLVTARLFPAAAGGGAPWLPHLQDAEVGRCRGSSSNAGVGASTDGGPGTAATAVDSSHLEEGADKTYRAQGSTVPRGSLVLDTISTDALEDEVDRMVKTKEHKPILMSKWSYVKQKLHTTGISKNKLEQQPKHPLYDALVINGGRLDELTKVMKGSANIDLQAPLDPVTGLPCALFYAIVKLRSPGIVKFLVDHGADINCELPGPRKWENIPPGTTPLAAVQLLCTMNPHEGDTRMITIEDILRGSKMCWRRSLTVSGRQMRNTLVLLNEEEEKEIALLRENEARTANIDKRSSALSTSTPGATVSPPEAVPALASAEKEESEPDAATTAKCGEQDEEVYPGVAPAASGKGRKIFRAKTGFAQLEMLAADGSSTESVGRKTAFVRCLTMHLSSPSTGNALGDARRHSFQGQAGAIFHTDSLFLCKHMEGQPGQVYDLEEEVGNGSFGTVRKARHKQTYQVHAVKTCPKAIIPKDELWSEIDIMKQLDHPHIMRIYSTFEDHDNIYISCEICKGGQLFDAIVSAGHLSEFSASRLAMQMMSAVSYLHCHHICHRDLKPENFLLATRKKDLSQAKVKLIDFGTARRFDLVKMTTKVCTVHYVAPEVLKRSVLEYTEKVDVWSCGVIIYVMLSGSPPFHHDDDLELLKLVKRGKYELKPGNVWDGISVCAKDLVKSMVCVKVQERLSASEVVKHEWMKEERPHNPAHEHVLDQALMRQMRKFLAHNKVKKAALHVIARQIDDTSIEKLRDIFLKFDKDNSGTIETSEMDDVLDELNVEDTVRMEMKRIMNELSCQDTNSTGLIDYTSFIAATIEKQHYLKEEVCRAAFHLFDVDGDGVISTEDMVALMAVQDSNTAKTVAGIDIEEISNIMSQADKNGDGEMCFEEFMNLMADGTIPMFSSKQKMDHNDMMHSRAGDKPDSD